MSDATSDNAFTIYQEAVRMCLVEFHNKSAQEAAALVRSIEESDTDMALHEEPYITAFELVHGDKIISIDQYRKDRQKALDIWERATRIVLKDNVV